MSNPRMDEDCGAFTAGCESEGKSGSHPAKSHGQMSARFVPDLPQMSRRFDGGFAPDERS